MQCGVWRDWHSGGESEQTDELCRDPWVEVAGPDERKQQRHDAENEGRDAPVVDSVAPLAA